MTTVDNPAASNFESTSDKNSAYVYKFSSNVIVIT